MRMTYDKEADAAYIYIKNKILPGEVKNTISLNDNINVDFDRNKKIIGIEVLNARKNMPNIKELSKIAA